MDDPLPQPAWQPWHDDDEPIRIGISSCLLGAAVRHDGGDKRDRFLVDVLGRWVDWAPVCPEVEIGLGVPRPTIRLERAEPSPRVIEPRSGEDLSLRLAAFAKTRVDELQRLGLDGYILKKGSPSCGMERVRVFGTGGRPKRNGVGAFARVLIKRCPNMPVEEERRLSDPKLRENFIEHVFCRHRWLSVKRRELTQERLVEYHTAHELMLRAHNEVAYRRLSRIVAACGATPGNELFHAYEDELHRALTTRTTARRHAKVLFHTLRHLEHVLEPAERQDAVEAIEKFQAGLAPLTVPLTLIRHHAIRHRIPYLLGQLYLEPHPAELMLRNRV